MNQLIDLIGNTPLVSVKSPNPKVEIYCKLEGQNPGGSVKDRAAYSMIKGALDRGEIKTGDHLVEATSGNTGIALAMIAAALGLNMHLIMPDTATEERVGAMRAYGAEVILTPGVKTIEYSRTLADELHQSKGYYLLNQFANDDNWLAHYRSTGPEIWRDTNGKISHFVSSMGTTGTIMGVSKYLKEQNRAIQIVGAQPTEGSKIPGIRRWSPEFLPKIFDASRVDQVRDVSRYEAENQMKLMAKEDAIFGGISSGGALFLAKKLALELEEGLIVCITCDRGDRYLSTGIFS
ncbi:cysteine synthase CysM [Flavobacteriaceae bacterium]|nr:cysteine synthase CysM [Flavobacteriaceae bacterium]